MKTPWRIFLLLLVSFVIFLGVFYTPFVVNNILMPLALVVWWFLRTFFLHIDQKDYWFLLICAGVILALYRLGQALLNAGPEEPAEGPEPNSMTDEINNWFIEIRNLGTSEIEQRAIRRKLVDLLVSLYTTRNRDTMPGETLEALKQRQISLPEPIYQFLFAESIDENKLSPLKRALHFIQYAPRKWARRVTGREKAEFYQSIEDILSFIENALEITHDETFDPNTR